MQPTFASALDHVYRQALQKLHPDHHERLEKGYKLAYSGQVTPLDQPHQWQITSSNATPHIVAHQDGWQCTCEDRRYHPDEACKHILAVQLWKRARQAVQAAEQVVEEDQTKLMLTSTLPLFVEEQRDTVSTQPVPLPEAPVSCNVHVQIAGRDVLVTLRGTDEAEVLGRLETLLQRYPVQPSSLAAASAKQCPIHGATMKQNHKEGRTWWSHRQGDSWCKGR